MRRPTEVEYNGKTMDLCAALQLIMRRCKLRSGEGRRRGYRRTKHDEEDSTNG